MNKEEVCKNCKFHYIEEISFDYPQSICRKEDKIHYTTEEWLNCNDFVYSEEYVKQLQQENKQLKDNWGKLKEYLKDYNSLCYIFENDYKHEDCMNEILRKMQELEKGE